MTTFRPQMSLLLLGVFLSACSQAETPPSTQSPTTTAAETAAPSVEASPVTPAALPRVTVHKSPTCGCCKLWVEHLQHAGFSVQVVESDDLAPIKAQVGVPPGRGSCHTAQVAGYFVEGHVPADDIVRLLTERPDARGLALPGMPMGSPGMEVPSGEIQPYTVELVAKDGNTTAFSHHGH